jgi:hypothetical protein
MKKKKVLQKEEILEAVTVPRKMSLKKGFKDPHFGGVVIKSKTPN